MIDFWQAIDDARQALQPKPEDPAVIIVHPSIVSRIQHAQQSAPPLSRFSGVEVEVDAEMDPSFVCVVPHSQLEVYKRARQWATPWRAVNAAAAVEEHRSRFPSPAINLPSVKESYAREPQEPIKPRAVKEARRRFPIPR